MKKLNYQYSIVEEINRDGRVIYKVKDSIYDAISYCELFKEIPSNEWDLSLKIEDELRDLKYSKKILSYFDIEEDNLKRYYKVFENYPEDSLTDNKVDKNLIVKELAPIEPIEKNNLVVKELERKEKFVENKDDKKYDFYQSYLSDLSQRVSEMNQNSPRSESWEPLLESIVDFIDSFKEFHQDKTIFLDLEDCYFALEDSLEETRKAEKNNNFINKIEEEITPIKDYYTNKYKQYRRETLKPFSPKDITLSIEEMSKEYIVTTISYINKVKDIIHVLHNHKDIYLWHDLYDEMIVFLDLLKRLESYDTINYQIFLINDITEYILEDFEDIEDFDKYEELLSNMEDELDKILFGDNIPLDSKKLDTDEMIKEIVEEAYKKRKSEEKIITFIVLIIFIIVVISKIMSS